MPRARPTARPARSGMRRSTAAKKRRIRPRMRPLNALSFGLATGEFLDERFPVAALAQEAFDELAKRAAAAGRRELPRRRREHLGRSVGGRGGDRGGGDRREIGEVVADVEDLAEVDVELRGEALHFLQL